MFNNTTKFLMILIATIALSNIGCLSSGSSVAETTSDSDAAVDDDNNDDSGSSSSSSSGSSSSSSSSSSSGGGDQSPVIGQWFTESCNDDHKRFHLTLSNDTITISALEYSSAENCTNNFAATSSSEPIPVSAIGELDQTQFNFTLSPNFTFYYALLNLGEGNGGDQVFFFPVSNSNPNNLYYGELAIPSSSATEFVYNDLLQNENYATVEAFLTNPSDFFFMLNLTTRQDDNTFNITDYVTESWANVTLPEITSVAVASDGVTFTITFNKEVTAVSGGYPAIYSMFTLNISPSRSLTLYPWIETGIYTTNTFTARINAGTIYSTDTVKISFTADYSNKFHDADNFELQDFTDFDVTNNSTQVDPGL